MKIPYKLYYRTADQKANYDDDLKLFLEVMTEAEEVDYLDLLLKSYKDDRLYFNAVEFDFKSDSKPDSILPEGQSFGISVKGLSDIFPDLNCVLRYGVSRTKILERVVKRYYNSPEFLMSFNEVKYENEKAAYNKIIKWLTEKKERLETVTEGLPSKEVSSSITPIRTKMTALQIRGLFNYLRPLLDVNVDLHGLIELYFTAKNDTPLNPASRAEQKSKASQEDYVGNEDIKSIVNRVKDIKE